jgi:hypothetical protein
MALMTMREFIEEYCDDIRSLHTNMLNDPFASFRRDDINEEGNPIIYNSDGTEIPIEDIIHLTFQEFRAAYPDMSSAEAFRNYVSAYKITSGEDLFYELNARIKEHRAELESLRDVDTTNLSMF